MQDKFQNFDDLRRNFSESEYTIRIAGRNSNVAIIAPHGGKIEPGTSVVATTIAGDNFNLYCFEGNMPRGNRDLHITSRNFDEPQCLCLIRDCGIAVAIHGRQDKADPDRVYLGGLDTELKAQVDFNLSTAGFSTRLTGHRFLGTETTNICNRGRSRRGVQLELPRSLRDRLAADPERLGRFSGAVRAALSG